MPGTAIDQDSASTPHERTGFLDLLQEIRTHSSQDYGQDCSAGRHFCQVAINLIRTSENPTLLGHLLKSLDGAGAGVRVGFAHTLSDALLAQPTALAS